MEFGELQVYLTQLQISFCDIKSTYHSTLKFCWQQEYKISYVRERTNLLITNSSYISERTNPLITNSIQIDVF